MCLSLTYSLPLYLSISPSLSLSLSLCLSLPLFIFLVLYLSFTSPSHLPSSSHHDRSVSVPTSLVTLGLLHSFLHHLSFHIYLLSHKHMNTITAAIFQLEVLGTNMLARSSNPRLVRLARLFRLLPIRMIATEVPRGRCSARSACG